MICRPRRVLAAEAVKPPVFITLSVPREFQVMKGCLFQPGIAMLLGSSSAILSPSTIFQEQLSHPPSFVPFLSICVQLTSILVNGLLVMKNKPVDLSQSQKEKDIKWIITTVYTYNQSPRDVPRKLRWTSFTVSCLDKYIYIFCQKADSSSLCFNLKNIFERKSFIMMWVTVLD